MSNPFDYVNEILKGKKNLIVDDITEKDYNPYLTNRSLSYHRDCVLFANEMNMRHFLEKKMQFDFLLNTVRSQKRPIAKWVKPEKSEILECIKNAYNFSDNKAREAMNLLSDEQIQQLKKQTDIGGLGK
jgi:hypoxanthine phosphoribosyltransferase